MNYLLKEKFRPPSQTLHLTEPLRAMLDLGALQLFEPWLNSLTGGDGHPVLVIPGFTAGDRSTIVLRKFLSSLGYLPFGWKQGVNFGIRHEAFAGVGSFLQQNTNAKSAWLGKAWAVFTLGSWPKCTRNWCAR
jgi:hypothetical protein